MRHLSFQQGHVLARVCIAIRYLHLMREVGKIKRKRADFSRACLIVTALFLMGYTVVAPALVRASAMAALHLCAEAIVPSLAVFLMGAKILIGADITGFLARGPFRGLRRILGVSAGGLVAVLIGLVAGFPMGAVTLAALREKDAVSEEEAASLLPFCNNAGAGFVIGTVGAGFFGDVRVGVLLFAAGTMSSLLLIVLSRGARRGLSVLSCDRRGAEEKTAPGRMLSVLPAAVASGAAALLSICGFVLFFCVLSDVILALLRGAGISAPAVTEVMLRGVLEISGGLAALGGMPHSALTLPLAGAILGFGGISVLMQVVDRVEGRIPCRGYWRGRLLMAGVCAAWTAVFSLFFRASGSAW